MISGEDMTNGGRSTEAEIAVSSARFEHWDREANLREAIARIEALGLRVVSQSSIYETSLSAIKTSPGS